MAVGGLHHSAFDHGRRVTAMGVEMVRHAENVSIPRSKENLQVAFLYLLSLFWFSPGFWRLDQSLCISHLTFSLIKNA